MSKILEPTAWESPGEKLSWIKVWISVLTRPSTKTFEWILRDPQAGVARAFWWVSLTVFIGGTLQDLITAVVNSGGKDIESVLSMIVPNLLRALLSLVQVAVMAKAVQAITRKLFGRAGEYPDQVYAYAASFAPLYLIQSLIAGFPAIYCLVIPFVIYGFVLAIIGVMAVNRVNAVQALVAYLIIFFLVVVVVAILTLCVLLVVGPDLIQELQNTTGQTIPAAW